MLKNVPDVITPELLKILDEMGHGDRIVIGDCNFPAQSIAAAKGHACVRCDGHRATEIVDAILQLMPLDNFVEKPVMIMDKMEKDRDLETPVWDEFENIIGKYDKRGKETVEFVDRFRFYDVAKDAYAVVSSSEHAFYACIILQKGCL
ncbi:MAG: fucose isomerase [Lachnospiraceae bacterium]|jgi:L-fucose mutarotase|nr:fucose isomerase [Lachnospiraceae bacterium]MCI1398018.1 fucose isomerase [Lachnospiraceae bacterium]MCI1424133.1 fucose isomerase [Lachnospiraceae bacterium]MCI1452943.1 fucose isomerase [Lachnospiraceae bacterium]